MSHLHLDFETRSEVDLKNCGADVYARHPSTEVMCAAWALDDEPVQIITGGCKKVSLLPKYVEDGLTVIAHNSFFELLIWNHVMTPRYGWPELKIEQMQCTMAMSYAMGLPGALDNAAAAVGLDEHKDQEGRRIMMQLSKPRDVVECPICEGAKFVAWPKAREWHQAGAFTPCKSCNGRGEVPIWWNDQAKLERLYAYCKQDVEVERALFKRLRELSPEETKVWQLDWQINQRGIRVDMPAVKTAIRLVELEQNKLDEEMKTLTNNGVGMCTASTQLREWLNFRGVKTDSVDKPAVLAMLALPNLPADCRRALVLRQEAAKSSTAKLEAMMNGACADGRVRGTMQYHGAATGRWAGRRLQVHNFPRPKIDQDQIEEIFKVIGAVK